MTHFNNLQQEKISSTMQPYVPSPSTIQEEIIAQKKLKRQAPQPPPTIQGEIIAPKKLKRQAPQPPTTIQEKTTNFSDKTKQGPFFSLPKVENKSVHRSFLSKCVLGIKKLVDSLLFWKSKNTSKHTKSPVNKHITEVVSNSAAIENTYNAVKILDPEHIPDFYRSLEISTDPEIKSNIHSFNSFIRLSTVLLVNKKQMQNRDTETLDKGTVSLADPREKEACGAVCDTLDLRNPISILSESTPIPEASDKEVETAQQNTGAVIPIPPPMPSAQSTPVITLCKQALNSPTKEGNKREALLEEICSNRKPQLQSFDNKPKDNLSEIKGNILVNGLFNRVNQYILQQDEDEDDYSYNNGKDNDAWDDDADNKPVRLIKGSV